MLLTNVSFAGPKDVKDIYNVLKDNAAQLPQGNDTMSYQVHAISVHDVEAFKDCSVSCFLNLKCYISAK